MCRKPQHKLPALTPRCPLPTHRDLGEAATESDSGCSPRKTPNSPVFCPQAWRAVREAKRHGWARSKKPQNHV